MAGRRNLSVDAASRVKSGYAVLKRPPRVLEIIQNFRWLQIPEIFRDQRSSRCQKGTCIDSFIRRSCRQHRGSHRRTPAHRGEVTSTSAEVNLVIFFGWLSFPGTCVDKPKLRNWRSQGPPAFQPQWIRNIVMQKLCDRTLQSTLNFVQRTKI